MKSQTYPMLVWVWWSCVKCRQAAMTTSYWVGDCDHKLDALCYFQTEPNPSPCRSHCQAKRGIEGCVFKRLRARKPRGAKAVMELYNSQPVLL